MKSINQFSPNNNTLTTQDMHKVRGGQLKVTSKQIVEANGTRVTITARDKTHKVVVRVRVKDLN